MAAIPQWFVWRLQWDEQEGKYRKIPCGHDGRPLPEGEGASNPTTWTSFDAAERVVNALNGNVVEGSPLRYALGFWLTADSGYWFLDLDKAKDNNFAYQMVGAFNGCFVEWSSSGKGLHVIGRYAGAMPAHRCKPPREIKQQLAPLELEFYHDGRGIAFGLSGEAAGSVDTQADIHALVERYFPPREVADNGARVEWRGPADDDVLIERMLNARVSAAVTFGGKVGLPALWKGECERNSEHDMALASHLAFWTGADAERIERLMRRSGLVRSKWNERRPGGTYLTMTIERACESCENVYQEPERNLTVQRELYGAVGAVGGGEPFVIPGLATTVVNSEQPQLVSPEVFARVGVLLDAVAACATELELHNVVIPQIQQAGVPGALQERLVSAVKKKLKFWDNDMGVVKLRGLLFPSAMRRDVAGELPEWAQPFCFVSDGDYFYNLHNGQQLTMMGFQAVYGRVMPVTETGKRENAAEKCLHFWNMPVVERVGYRPDCGPFYTWDGVSYANLYSPSSLPLLATEYTAEGIAGINAFQSHIWDMCGRRQDVFNALLYWFAHNVQKPGIKIRWSPLLKGVNGDGKTLMTYVVRGAMGHRNVSTTSNSNLKNSGGFTDWAVRGAVNIIEEIMLKGEQRHAIYNETKEFITNNFVDINPKGSKPYQAYNTTNHIALTNHNDALPLEKTDRRWLVIFTPWGSLDEAMRYCGVDVAGWKGRMASIDHAVNNCAGELRKWFLSIQIPADFDINESALETPEKRRMKAMGQDSAEMAALDIIEGGGVPGITRDVFSSSILTQQLTWRAAQEGFEVPKTSNLNFMLTRLGYSQVERVIKWNGRTHRVWLRNGVELGNEDIRLRLDQPVT
jgi:hypothetical protein